MAVNLTLTPEEQAVYDELKKIAKAGQITTYGDLFQKVANNNPSYAYLAHKKYRRIWAKILGNISGYTHQNYGRLISSIVSNANTNYPGLGFFGLDGVPPRLQTKQTKLTPARKSFVDNERQQVWKHWKNDP